MSKHLSLTKKLSRTLFCLLLPALLFLFTLQGTVFADEDRTCGDDCTWSFTASTGTLTITGSGPMDDYNYPEHESPWYGQRDSIKNAVINGVTSIGNFAFYQCSALGSVTIGSSVTKIGNDAFFSCYSLNPVIIEENSQLDTIGNSAFVNCHALADFHIPAGVTSIGRSLFENCLKLESITVDPKNPDYKAVDGVLFSKDGEKQTLIRYPECKNGSSYSIPAGVTTIGYAAFIGCSGLTSIDIPAGVTTIDENAFRDCSGLTEVIIPAGVTTIGFAAFYGCSGLTEVIIPAGVTAIDNHAFSNCSGLKSVTVLTETPPELFALYAFQSIPDGCKFFLRNEKYWNNMYDWDDIVSKYDSKVISTITVNSVDPVITFSAEPEKHTHYGVDYYEQDSTVTLNVPAGYAVDASWNGTSIDPVSDVYSFTMPARDVTLSVSSYKIITYTLAYELNGGTLPHGKSNPDTYTVENESFTLVNPVREGHEFLGWTGTGLSDVTPTVTVSRGSTGNLTFYAQWKEIPAKPLSDPSIRMTLIPESYEYDGTLKTVTYQLFDEETGEALVEGVDFELDPARSVTAAVEPGTYTVTVTADNKAESSGTAAKSVSGSRYTGTRSASWEIVERRGMSFFRLFPDEMVLPNTGFSSRYRTALSVRPEGIVYQDLPLSLQIPRFGVEAALTVMPRQGNTWAAEWLGAKAGVLEGSPLPGEGVSLIASHNTLNEREYGPFARLSELEPQDKIFIRTAEGNLQRYQVSTNQLIDPADFKTLEAIAGRDPNTLLLITCETELPEGGYANRRVISATPAEK